MSQLNDIHDDDTAGKGFPPHHPFRASEDYFERFASRLSGQISALEEIQQHAPILSSIPRYNPFDVPAGYFDELPALVQQKAGNNNSRSSLPEWLLLIFRPRFAVPMIAVILLAIAGINFVDNHADAPSGYLAEELTVEEHLSTIDEMTIIESLAASATDLPQPETDESIEDYLLDNHIEESALNSEL